MIRQWRLMAASLCVVVGLVTVPQISHAESGQAYTKVNSDSALSKLIPVGATLIGTSTSRYPAKVNRNASVLHLKEGATRYSAAAFVYHNRIGIIIARPTQVGYTRVWSHTGLIGEALSSLRPIFLSGDSSPQLLVGTYVGASGGNQWTLIGWRASRPIILFQRIANRIDVGTTYHLNQNQFALWHHDTGPLYNIQIHGLRSGAIVDYGNSDVPAYFREVVIPYYLEQASVPAVPAKMVDYGLAEGYVYAGDYAMAKSIIRKALKITGYPDNGEFVALQKQMQR